jgi:hypothetical protein
MLLIVLWIVQQNDVPDFQSGIDVFRNIAALVQGEDPA